MRITKKVSKKLKEGNTPFLILICGMPGTRKSSTAVMLGGLLEFSSVIGMDEVRDIMKIYDQRPLVSSKSHYCWEMFGGFNPKNFTKGYYAHSRALKKGVMAAIKKNMALGENTIIEGVHLAPSLYQKIPGARKFHFVLISKDFQHHNRLLNKKFSRRHGRQKPWPESKIRKVEAIQEILSKNAAKYNAILIDSENPRKNCQKIISCLDKNL